MASLSWRRNLIFHYNSPVILDMEAVMSSMFVGPLTEVVPLKTTDVPLSRIPSLLPSDPLLALLRAVEAGLAGTGRTPLLQVTSGRGGEGSSTVAWELAVLTAETLHRRTLFVDASRHLAPIGKALRGQPLASLIDLAEGRATAEEAVLQLGEARMLHYAVVNDAPTTRPLGRPELVGKCLRALASAFDLVVVDASAVLSDPNALALAATADGVVFVVAAEVTRAPVAQRAIRALRACGAPLIGSVLNRRQYPIPAALYDRL
jgi:Mrp family chromosome partitioning ATPase